MRVWLRRPRLGIALRAGLCVLLLYLIYRCYEPTPLHFRYFGL